VCPGLAHQTVRCTRVNQLKLFSFGFPRRSSAIIHRTVRCTSGATTICAQRSTLMDEQYRARSQSSGQRGTGVSGVTPDCPVPHEDKASNGRPAPSPNYKMTWRGGRPPAPGGRAHQLQDDVAAHRTLSGAPFTSRLHQRLDFGWWL
jgi:hypothetical protein